MIRKSAKTWMSLVLLTAAGCSSLHDCIVGHEMQAKNFVVTQKAWSEWSWCYDDLEHPFHFSKGFKDGYKSVLEGGKGCQPTLPPRCYWKPCFQSPAGRCQIAAWFDGFSHGALAAQQDGYGNMNQIPISPTARQNLMTRHAPVSPACFDGMYHGDIPDGQLIPQAEDEPLPEEPLVAPGPQPEGVDAPNDGNPIQVRPYDDSK